MWKAIAVFGVVIMFLAFIGSMFPDKKSIARGGQGQEAYMTQDFFGCPTASVTIDVIRMAERDREAALLMAQRAECMPLHRAVLYHKEDFSVLNNSVCLHIDGTPDCYWTPTAMVEK